MYKITKEPAQTNHPLSPKANAPMLSEVKIQLPKPQPAKKVISQHQIVQHIDSTRHAEYESSPQKGDSLCALFSGSKTKNSSASLPFRTQSEIISEWIRNLFHKRGLLGPQWQQKMRRKKKQLIRYAFNVVREYEPRQPSGYLQTQSRHKPYFRACNQLHMLGLEKLAQIIPRMAMKSKQYAFSSILRFLAFQHMKKSTSNPGSDSLTNSIAPSLRASSRNTAQPRLILNYASRQEYDIQNSNHNYINTKSIRQVQSSKHLPLVENQYALAPIAPVSPFEQIQTAKHRQVQNVKQEEIVRTPRSSRHQVRNSHGLTSSRQSGKHQIQNRVMYDPRFQLIKLKESQYIYSTNNPPSPKTHGLGNPQSNENMYPAPQQNIPSRPDSQRNSAHARPHTHNPFTTNSKSNQKKTLKIQQTQPDSRSRAVSASNNIKISFMGNHAHYLQHKKDVPQDYEEQQKHIVSKQKNMHKLGTLENKQMRQSYQMNSLNNELIPQDYPRTANIFYSPNAPICSSPVTPKILHSPVAKGAYISPPMTQNSPYQSQSPVGIHQLGRQTHRPHKNPQNKRSAHNNIGENDYNFRRRQKLVVTSSRRRH